MMTNDDIARKEYRKKYYAWFIIGCIVITSLFNLNSKFIIENNITIMSILVAFQITALSTLLSSNKAVELYNYPVAKHKNSLNKITKRVSILIISMFIFLAFLVIVGSFNGLSFNFHFIPQSENLLIIICVLKKLFKAMILSCMIVLLFENSLLGKDLIYIFTSNRDKP